MRLTPCAYAFFQFLPPAPCPLPFSASPRALTVFRGIDILFSDFSGILFSSLMNYDGFVKSPSAALRFTFVVAAYLVVRLSPQLLRALHMELFTLPSQF